MPNKTSSISAPLPRVEVTPEATVYGQATARGLYVVLAVVLSLIALAHFSTTVPAATLSDYIVTTVKVIGKAVLSFELFLTSSHIQYVVVAGLGYYLLISELRTLNLVAGLEAKATPTRDDVKAALRLERSREVLSALWVLSVVFFGVVSLVSLIPKAFMDITPDRDLTLLSIITVVGLYLLFHSPIAGFLVHKSLRDRVKENDGTRQSAMRVCQIRHWSFDSVELRDYCPFYLYCLAKKANSVDLLFAFCREWRSPWYQWTPDFEKLEGAIAERRAQELKKQAEEEAREAEEQRAAEQRADNS